MISSVLRREQSVAIHVDHLTGQSRRLLPRTALARVEIVEDHQHVGGSDDAVVVDVERFCVFWYCVVGVVQGGATTAARER